MAPHFFESSSELHQWFLAHQGKADELWVGIYKKESGKESISWEDLKVEILVFGWAESLIQPIDETSFAVRITPRKGKSKWSLKNVEKALVLLDAGLLKPAGVRALENRDLTYEEDLKKRNAIQALSPEYEEKLKAHPKAWHYFETVAPSYRKQAIRWVMSAKQEKTRLNRLDILIESSEEGVKVPPMRPRKK